MSTKQESLFIKNVISTVLLAYVKHLKPTQGETFLTFVDFYLYFTMIS